MALGFYTYTCVTSTANQYIGNTAISTVSPASNSTSTNSTSLFDTTERDNSTNQATNTITKVIIKKEGFSWYYGVIIAAIILIPIFGIVLYMLRKNKVMNEDESNKMKISSAAENVDWGLENDDKQSDRKGKDSNDLVQPFDVIPPETSNMSLNDLPNAS